MQNRAGVFGPLDRCDMGKTKLKGFTGNMESRIMNRLQGPEFNEKFLIADLDFNQERWFTNYSGDISGRFLEVMSLAGNGNPDYHPALPFMLKHVPENQREAGHFGIKVDWSDPIDYERPTADGSRPPVPRMMPILWGASRIFTGLIEAYLAFGDERMLEAAEKLGDFYINTQKELVDENRVEEYRLTGTYAAGYATCYFPGMEGLARLYEVTGKVKYLEQAKRMAQFRQEHQFDALPFEHTHGFLCCVYSLLLLYKMSGEDKWLRMAEKNWNALVEGGFVAPSGGLLEKGVPGFHRDEGCSQADWLRVSLLFFELTGADWYLDMAERVLFNQMKINQCDTGGFGHRRVLYDAVGVAGYGKYEEEALWCCDFHGAMTLQNLKKYTLLKDKQDSSVYLIPLFLEFEAQDDNVAVSLETLDETEENKRWKLKIVSKRKENAEIQIRIPDWAGHVSLSMEDGTAADVKIRGNRLCLITKKEEAAYICEMVCPVYLEDRKFHKWTAGRPQGDTACILRKGPDLLAVKAGEERPSVLDRLKDNEEASYIFQIQAAEIKNR